MDPKLVYLAGFFDGEGCIHVGSYRRGDRRYHRLTVSVSQNDPAPLHMLAAMFGGSVLPDPGRAYIWQRVGWAASRALTQLLPHLIVKREQAELGIWFQQSFEGHKRGARRITPLEMAERDSFVLAVSDVRTGRWTNA